MATRRRVKLEVPSIEAETWPTRFRDRVRNRSARARGVVGWILLAALAAPLVLLAILGLLYDPPVPSWLDWTQRSLATKVVSAFLFLIFVFVVVLILDH